MPALDRAEKDLTYTLSSWGDKLRAMTLWQPWASFMVARRRHLPSMVQLAVKTVETRSWPTSHRGPLLVHSARREPAWVRELFLDSKDLRQLLQEYLCPLYQDQNVVRCYDQLPRGAVLGVVQLQSCHRMADMAGDLICRDTLELMLGNWHPDRFAWVTAHMNRLQRPVACRGGQRLWTIGSELQAQIAEQVVAESGYRA